MKSNGVSGLFSGVSLCYTKGTKCFPKLSKFPQKVNNFAHYYTITDHLIFSFYFQHDIHQSILASKRMTKLIFKYTTDEYDYQSNVSRIQNFRNHHLMREVALGPKTKGLPNLIKGQDLLM